MDKFKIKFILFLVALFLIKLPPFYLFLVNSSLFTTHVVAKIAILVVLINLIYYHIINKITLPRSSRIFILITAYFISQSLSIVAAKDTFLFLKYYQTIIFDCLIFVLAYYFVLSRPKLLYTLFSFAVVTGITCLGFELSYIFFNKFIIDVFNIFLQKEVQIQYLFDLDRGRYYLYIMPEYFLPFFLYLLYKSINRKLIIKSLGYVFISICLVSVSFFSNFRRPVVTSIFCIVFFLFYLYKSRMLRVSMSFIVLIITLIISILITVSISNKLFKFNVIDRFVLQNEITDLGSLDFRLDQFNNSMDLFKQSPLIGIGLGNFRYYIGKPISVYFSSSKRDIQINSDVNPHSVISRTLAETGILGIFSFGLMIVLFAINDFFFIMHNKVFMQLPFIISFWAMFVFALFSPFDTVFMNGWFWFFRGILEGYYCSRNKA